MKETARGEMLGHILVTKQTGPAGREVKRVYVEEGCDIKRELYLGMLIDRKTSRLTVMASTEGGMEIEVVAAKHPENIIRLAIDPATGHGRHSMRASIAFGAAASKSKQVAASATKFMTAMYKAFIELDCSIVEINPLVVTGAGDVLALDAKMNFDDNALFRHKDIEELRDEAEEDPIELEAGKHSLNYVKLDGNIGYAWCRRRRQLAMATMDIIKLYGGSTRSELPRCRRRRLRRGARHHRLQAHPLQTRTSKAYWSTLSSVASCAATSSPRASSPRRAKVKLAGAAGRAARGHQCQPRQEDPRRNPALPILVAADDLADAAEKVVQGRERGGGVMS